MRSPERPLLIFDGDCSFCRLWIDFWWQITDRRVDYRPSQTTAADYPEIPADQFEKSVVLIHPDGQVFTAAEAVFRVIAETPGYGWLLWLYLHLPGFSWISETVYKVVARYRDAGYWLTITLWGRKLEPASYRLTRWLFLRLLGVVYLFAFWSLALQMTGLYGSRGILPIADYLKAGSESVGIRGYLLAPSIFWLNASDAVIQLVPWIGVALALLLIAGTAQRLTLILLYVLYLSIFSAGQEFMAFQWDLLLIETGFVAIFLASGNWLPRWPEQEAEPPRVVVWLLRWVLFRLMFGSGIVKVLSGDSAWSGLNALMYHYWTQPLPTPLAWYAHLLPDWVNRFSVLLVFAVEIGLPLLMVLPRRPRQWAAGGVVLLQLVIGLTGNYGFFNLLTIALCLPLLDDLALRRFAPAQLAGHSTTEADRKSAGKIQLWASRTAAVVILLSSSARFALQLSHGEMVIPVAIDAARLTDSFEIANTYGLFAVMTRQRNEIIIEGSNDGETWQPYEFRFKPGDTQRGLPFVEPFMPRLDWQMWFAALGPSQASPWFENLLLRLLEGSPEVTRLLADNPFPDHPPRFIRALFYSYQFSSPDELRATGRWWMRQEIGVYVPEASLTSGNP